MNHLTSSLEPNEQQIITDLKANSALTIDEFTGLIQTLDFADCGQESRQFQHVRSLQEMGVFAQRTEKVELGEETRKNPMNEIPTGRHILFLFHQPSFSP